MSAAKSLGEIPLGSSPTGTPNTPEGNLRLATKRHSLGLYFENDAI